MSARLRAWWPALLWAALIFAVSARPSVPVPLGDGRDKIAHFLAYSVLGLFLARGQVRSGLPAWAAVLVGVLYGASDELHQHFVPGRAMELADWVADALGVVAGSLAFHFWRRGRRGAGRRASTALAQSLRS